MKKAISVLIILALAVSVCSCAAKSAPYTNASQSMTTIAEYNTERSSAALQTEENGADNGEEIISNTKLNLNSAENRKIIYEAHLRLEAVDFDAATTSILQQLEQLDGYVSSSSVEGQMGVSKRYAEYTFKIPQQNYNKMLSAISQNTNVLSQSENAQDITSEYIDIEARLKSLKTQEERLLDMMKSAGELETLLAVQNQLADVQYRIESITAQKNTYDQLIEFTTINITLDEVYRITETQKETFMQKLGIAFRESWIDFADGVQDFVLDLIYFLPSLLIMAVVAAAFMLIIRKAVKFKKKKQKPLPPSEPVKEELKQ